MKYRLPPNAVKNIVTVVVLVTVGAAWTFRSHWIPTAQGWVSTTITTHKKDQPSDTKHDHGAQAEEDSHAGHDHSGHAHAGHDEMSSLELSKQARRNVGLTDENVRPIQLQTFTRNINVPAMVVERPGRTRIKVVAPMTGVVTAVYTVDGEAVPQGSRMFKLRLIHEDLVKAQTIFLQTLGEVDIENLEIARLIDVTKSGAVAKKNLLQREYAKQKLEAALNAYREALLLHGLSEEQIAQIAETRHLLSEMEVTAPLVIEESGEVRMTKPRGTKVSLVSAVDGSASDDRGKLPFIVQELNVNKGEFVRAGDTLCVLVDYRELYIEGRAFEQDANELATAANKKWKLSATLEGNNRKPEIVRDLEITYLDHKIEPDSRAFHFYVPLPNRIIHDSTTADGRRYLTWRFKPGQRMQVQVPVEQWPDRIVLPVDAVAQDGAEFYVFQENGDHFDRRPVHVEFQDQVSAVIANDGSLYPGDTVAYTGAHQLQMALKNKAGGGVDPHAGHNH